METVSAARGHLVFGSDIGGVIMDRANDNTDTSFFSDNFLATTATAGAFEALAALADLCEGRIHLVSKCGTKIREKTLRWLDHHDFYRRTGIVSANVHFCRTRDGKAPICRALGITHFVDDRLEVLGYLEGGVPHRVLFRPDPAEVRRYSAKLPGVRVATEWADIVAFAQGSV